MISESDVAVVVAIAVLATPALFLASVVAGVVARKQRGIIGPRLSALVALGGGLALGRLGLFGTQLALLNPLLGVPIVIAVSLWRARRRAQAGWLITGVALPWTLPWGFYTPPTPSSLCSTSVSASAGGPMVRSVEPCANGWSRCS